MSSNDTTVSAPTFQYQAPPDFEGRQNTINAAYTSALAKTQLARSNLYTNAGLVNGTGNLDQNNQYGGIQQLLHSEGQQLSADDTNEEHRGLGLDSGLGAQNAAQIGYQEHLGASNIGTQLTQGLSGYDQSDTDALTQKNLDTTAVQTDRASYNSQYNAYQDALASYLKSIAPPTAPVYDNTSPGNIDPTQGAAERAINNNANAVKVASKPKAGKVTVNSGHVVGGV